MEKSYEYEVVVNARKHFFRERKSYNIKCNTMYLTWKRGFFEKDDYKTWTERSEKWCKYYTCKECEDEGNRKGACGENKVMKHHVLKREQIAVKRDHDIIPWKEEKMKWILKVILWNTNRQCMWRMLKTIFDIEKNLTNIKCYII